MRAQSPLWKRRYFFRLWISLDRKRSVEASEIGQYKRNLHENTANQIAHDLHSSFKLTSSLRRLSFIAFWQVFCFCCVVSILYSALLLIEFNIKARTHTGTRDRQETEETSGSCFLFRTSEEKKCFLFLCFQNKIVKECFLFLCFRNNDSKTLFLVSLFRKHGLKKVFLVSLFPKQNFKKLFLVSLFPKEPMFQRTKCFCFHLKLDIISSNCDSLVLIFI